MGLVTPSMIIKIDPKLLEDAENHFEEVSKAIVKEMGYMNQVLRHERHDPQYGYDKEFLKLWNDRFKEKLDLKNPADIKLLLFKNLLNTLDVKDVYEWNEMTFFTSDHCSKLEATLFRKRVYRLLDIYHAFVSGHSSFQDLETLLKSKKPQAALPYEALWLGCLLTTKISLKTFSEKYPTLTEALQDIEEFGLGNGTQAMQRAQLQEIVDKWELFKNQENSDWVQMNKKLLFQILLKGCINILNAQKSDFPLDKFIQSIPGVAEIANREKFTARSFQLAADHLDKAFANAKKRGNELLEMGIHNVFPHKGHFVLFFPQGQENNIEFVAKSLIE